MRSLGIFRVNLYRRTLHVLLCTIYMPVGVMVVVVVDGIRVEVSLRLEFGSQPATSYFLSRAIG